MLRGCAMSVQQRSQPSSVVMQGTLEHPQQSQWLPDHLAGRIVVPSELPEPLLRLLKLWQQLYEQPDLEQLRAVCNTIFAVGSVFSDPLQYAEGRDVIYREFAVLRKLFWPVKLQQCSASLAIVAVVGASSQSTPLLELSLDNIQTFSNPLSKLLPSFLLGKLIPRTIQLHVTSVLYIDTEQQSEGITGKILFHQDIWHNIPTPPQAVRAASCKVVDFFLRMMFGSS